MDKGYFYNRSHFFWKLFFLSFFHHRNLSRATHKILSSYIFVSRKSNVKLTLLLIGFLKKDFCDQEEK